MEEKFNTRFDQKWFANLKERYQIPSREYEQMWLGNWVVASCSVNDNKGNHCPDKAEHFLEYKGEKVRLCDRCFKNFEAGAYRGKYGEYVYLGRKRIT